MTSGTQRLRPMEAARVRYITDLRLAPFLRESNGDTGRALRLYSWNIEMSGAAYEVLHRFEVLLRNAIDPACAPGTRPRSPGRLESRTRLTGSWTSTSLGTARASRARAGCAPRSSGGRQPSEHHPTPR